MHTISSNHWIPELFAIEVGARGYCSRSLTTCLKRLGFCNKSAFSSAKKLGHTSMTASFCIWLSRQNKVWTQDVPTLAPTLSPKSQENNGRTKCKVKPPRPPTKASVHKSKINAVHAGFINKGNTCYANSILQAISVIPSLWSQWPSESPQLSPLVKSISLNMALLKRSTAPVDPSNLLRALDQKVRSIRETPFNFNAQQDVPEILNIVLDELKGLSPLAANIFSSTIVSTITCDTCFCSSLNEEKLDMLSITPKKHISSALKDFLQTEYLKGQNMWFCPQCSALRDSCKETKITHVGRVMILQLKRYSNFNGSVVKDYKLVECLPERNHTLTVPIKSSDPVSFSNRYSLMATINHAGTVHAGHYWAFVKDIENDVWLKCNDRSVVEVPAKTLNNNSAYVLFYVRD